jgi:hypothetical protein
MRAIASSGLIWPVAGVEAMRIFIGIDPLIADKGRLVRTAARLNREGSSNIFVTT